jgi:ubiquinone/menaquinone biosynthesis C-methylase UbiE
MKNFLHVGCGTRPKSHTTKGFQKASWEEVRFDIDKSVNPDVVGSVADMHFFESSSFDALFSSHNIEHLYAHEVTAAFSEFFRVVNQSGFVVITCPDLQSVCQLIADDKLTDTAYTSPAGPIAPLDILYGHRQSIASGNQYMAHKCGFTAKVLTASLATAGFQTVALKRRPNYFDLWAIATKKKKEKAHLEELCQEHFP